MQLTQCINYLLTHAQNTVHLQFKAQLAPFDITPVQYMVLYFLSGEPCLSPSQLAQLCNLDTSTMTGILTRMEKKGFLQRQHSTDDRRSVDIAITPEGAALLPEILQVVESCNQETLRRLSPEEQNNLKDYLLRIAARE